MYVSRKCFDQNGPDVTPKIVIKSKTKGLTRNVFARKLISETMFICYSHCAIKLYNILKLSGGVPMSNKRLR